MTKPVIFIDGDQGTTGLQIHSRLQARSDITLITLPDDRRKKRTEREKALNECDIAILCLPDEAAREAVSLISNPSVRIIDASSAHRLSEGWTYGFPELTHDQPVAISRAWKVSNPGCYPTGAVGLLHPLIQAGLIPPDYPFVISAVSGYSGGGREATERFEKQATSAGVAYQAYGLQLRHKHVPEIQYYAGLSAAPLFLPAYAGFRQGILLTIPLLHTQIPVGIATEQLHTCLTQHYASSRFVRVMPSDESSALDRMDPQKLNGTDDMELSVFSGPGQTVLTAVLDNLGKGAAGAAVRNLDLMLQV